MLKINCLLHSIHAKTVAKNHLELGFSLYFLSIRLTSSFLLEGILKFLENANNHDCRNHTHDFPCLYGKLVFEY